MDSLVRCFDYEPDGDLRICAGRGVAYQADMTAGRVSYGADYLAKVDGYEDTPVARRVNLGRCRFLQAWLPQGSWVLDVGAGSGAFVRAAIEAGYRARGFDVIPESAARLKAARLYDTDAAGFGAVTFWDALEHMEEPERWLLRVSEGAAVFVSLPIFADLRAIRASKHYRPGEHLYYWTADGFVNWMALYGYRLIARSAHETEAGREDIGAFAFRREPLR